MKAMEKNWILKSQGEGHKVERMSGELNISKPLATLLIQRGIHSFEEARDFFRPQLTQLHDPFLMKDMAVAIERIQTAVQDSEKVLVYGDYDVDGTTSVALVYTFLKKFHDSGRYRPGQQRWCPGLYLPEKIP